MTKFREWLSYTENLQYTVISQKTAFVQLFQRIFQDAQISQQPSHVKAMATVADRNIVCDWYAGLNPRKGGDENQEKESHVKIDFFHTKETDTGDFVGVLSKSGMQPNALSFMKSLLPLVKGLKQAGIHISFDAVGMDRADSYAEMLKKFGYTLGIYKGYIQLWLAHPVDSLQPTENPYADKAGFAKKKERADAAKVAAASAPPSDPTVPAGWGRLSM